MQTSYRTRPGRGRRAALAVLSLALPAALTAGCGSSGPSTTKSTQNPGGSAVTAAFAYARCMRTHGVPSFPDPKVSTSPGRMAVGFHVTPSETASPSFKSASRACQPILPGPNGLSPAEQRARKAGFLAFARCVRAKGIAGFPDPDVQGRLSLRMVSEAGVDIHSRKVLDAAKSCVAVSNGAVRLADVEAAENGAH